MARRRTIAWVTGTDGKAGSSNTINFPRRDEQPFPIVDEKLTPVSVPKPTRDHIRNAHLLGLSIPDIAKTFGYPVEWVEEFVKPDPIEENSEDT